MRRIICRRAVAWLLFSAVVALLPMQVSAQSKIPVRIGIQPNILPELVLKTQGTLEKKYGDRYDFQWINVTHAGAAIEAMIARSIDITHAAALPLIQANARGLPIWGVADAVGDVAGIVVRADSGIKTAADLKGKTIAYPGKGSLPYALIELALEGSDVRVSDINLVVARYPEMPLLLEKKAVDGFAGTEPFISMTVSKGLARAYLKPSDKLQQKEGTFIVGQIGVHADFAREHPDALKAFLREFQEASRFIKKNPDTVADIFGKVYPNVVTKASFNYAITHGLTYLNNIKPDEKDWVKMINFTNKSGLTKITDPKKFLDGYLHPEFIDP